MTQSRASLSGELRAAYCLHSAANSARDQLSLRSSRASTPVASRAADHPPGCIDCFFGFMLRQLTMEADFADRHPPVLRAAPQPSELFASLLLPDSRPRVESVLLSDQKTYRYPLSVRVQRQHVGSAMPILPSQREPEETRPLLANESIPMMLEQSCLPQEKTCPSTCKSFPSSRKPAQQRKRKSG